MRDFVIDIGNSRIKTALFSRAGELLATKSFGHGDWREVYDYLTNLGAQNLIYSSVANEPPTAWLKHLAEGGIASWSLDRQKPLPFSSRYQTMETIGKDRLAALAGASVMFPEEHCLVVDAGTCITYDLLTADGVYRGGNIAPGIRMRLNSMHRDTSRLPLVETTDLTANLGLTTETALQIGGQGGVAMELEGLYYRLAAQWTPLNVVLTGGDAGKLKDYLRLDSIWQPNLVLHGLHKIMTIYAATTV